MTNPVPTLVAGIDTPVPDAFQNALRATVVQAMNYMAQQHQALEDQLTATQTALTALTARVVKLEPPAVPPAAPTPTV